jgi:hypothetical protein
MGTKFSAPFQTSPWAQRPGRGAEFKESVQLYLYSHSGPSWPVVV